jgi:putative ATPase
MPEGLFAIAQCCTYLATAPKSNASYVAFTAAKADIDAHGALPVPLHLRNAPTTLLRREGHGRDYRYPHDEGGFARGATYLPEVLAGRRYYTPKRSGYEQRIAERLARLRGDERARDEAGESDAPRPAEAPPRDDGSS